MCSLAEEGAQEGRAALEPPWRRPDGNLFVRGLFALCLATSQGPRCRLCLDLSGASVRLCLAAPSPWCLPTSQGDGETQPRDQTKSMFSASIQLHRWLSGWAQPCSRRSSEGEALRGLWDPLFRGGCENPDPQGARLPGCSSPHAWLAFLAPHCFTEGNGVSVSGPFLGSSPLSAQIPEASDSHRQPPRGAWNSEPAQAARVPEEPVSGLRGFISRRRAVFLGSS